MNYLTVDAVMVARLQSVPGPVEIRDEAGKVVGNFTPALPSDQAPIFTQFELEEAERILATERDTGRPLADILRDLQTRESVA